MALPASDAFTRADAGTLGANWTNQYAGLGVVSNEAAPASAFENVAFWNADSFAADHYSEAVIGTAAEDDGPSVRASGTGVGTRNLYAIAGKSVGEAGNTRLTKYVGDTNTDIQTGLGTVAPGDVLRLTAIGTALTCLKNGAALGITVTDAALASGAAGIYEFFHAGDGSGRITSWSANNATAVSAPPIRNVQQQTVYRM